MGRATEAQEVFEKILALAPNDAYAADNLRRVRQAMNDEAGAESAIPAGKPSARKR